MGFHILSNPGKHRILSLVSAAVLSPSRSGCPGSEPIIPQPFHLEQPTCPLSLLSSSLWCSPWGDFSVMSSFKVPHRPDVSSVPSWSFPSLCLVLPLAPAAPSLLSTLRSHLLFLLPASLGATDCQDVWILSRSHRN